MTISHTRFTYPGGKVEDIKTWAGQVLHFDAFEPNPENLLGASRCVGAPFFSELTLETDAGGPTGCA